MSLEPLKILLVEDSADDRALIARALQDLDQPTITECVASEADLREALARFGPDAVLSDFSMPGFSGQRALEVVQEVAPTVPFLFVSGTIGEERAIDAMQRGASDYVLKDNLRRLRPSLERALRRAAERDELQAAESALRESEERFRAIVDTTGDWIWQTDAEGRITYSNDAVAAMLGHSAASLIGRPALDLLVDEDRDEALAQRGEYVAAQRGWRDEIRRWRHADGSIVLIESTAKPMVDGEGRLLGYRGINRDVTLRMQQATKIEHLARMHAVLSAFGNAILRSRDTAALLDMTCRLLVDQGGFHLAFVSTVDDDGRLRVAHVHGRRALADRLARLEPLDPMAESSHDRPSVRALRSGRTTIVADFSSADVSDLFREQARAFGAGAQVSLPIGNPAWGVLSLCTQRPQDFDQEEVALLQRLTGEIDYARKFIAQSERLEHLVYRNPTTDLPSRAALQETFGDRLARGQHVVAMVDVDRFRYFNQTRGRGFGDELLQEMAARLGERLPADAMLVHPGDDAFIVAYRSDADIEPAVAEVEALVNACCERPLLVGGEQVRARLHAGVLLAPAQAADADELERALSDAVAEARSRDRTVQAFTEEARTRTARRVDLERDLRVALEQEDFELHMQPKFSTGTHQLRGAEALLRWRHPSRGLVSPAEFIPVLEETGLIVDVGAWVRREGLRITRRWRELGSGGVRLAVNVSVQELRQVDFVSQCEALLADCEGDHDLDIEITESMLMDDVQRHISVLQAMRDLGCQIAIDDFGTGYSSLNYLARLPADTLKIDRSFVALLAQSPDTVSLVTNVVTLAHSLGLRVVAEGVEEEEQAKLLRLLRCDELQGYLLGRPVPLSEFERLYLG